MKQLFRAALFAAPLFALACSAAPSENDPESELSQQSSALIPLDADPGPGPDIDAGPPPPPPSPPTTTCSNQTIDGQCMRYCCSESASLKRCGVLPCPTPTKLGTVVVTGTLLMK